MAQKLARTQGTSRRGLNTHSMDYQVTYQHSLRSAPEDFIVHVPSQMVCNVPATVDQIIQRLCPSGVLPQSAFGGNRRCRRCAGLQGDAIFSSLRVRSGRRAAGSLNATQLIRLISIETTGKRRNERRAAVLTAASELRGVIRAIYPFISGLWCNSDTPVCYARVFDEHEPMRKIHRYLQTQRKKWGAAILMFVVTMLSGFCGMRSLQSLPL